MNHAILHSILSGARPATTYAQPIVGLKDGAIRAQEMLTRFHGEDGAMHTVGHLLDDPSLSPELRARLDSASPAEIQEFLNHFAGTYQEDRLRNDWLLLLGQHL